MKLKNIFDIRSLMPRERRRISHREVAKGVMGQLRGHSITQAEAQKRAQRRCHKRAMTKAVIDGLTENPAGSKLLRRFAKSAGFVVMDSDGKRDFVRKPTAIECEKWYAGREDEAPFLIGKRLTIEQQLRQKAWFLTRSGKADAVREVA